VANTGDQVLTNSRLHGKIAVSIHIDHQNGEYLQISAIVNGSGLLPSTRRN
jgi:hypothetical protein